MVSTDLLFEPFRLKGLSLPNRVVMAPMTRSRSAGQVPDADVAAYYRRRAEGGVGLILTEGTSPEHLSASNDANVPAFFGDASLKGWANVLKDVKAAGGHIMPQLWHQGIVRHKGSGPYPEQPSMSPSGIAKPGKKVAEPMTTKDIDDVIAGFAASAGYAKDLGFDGVEIHGAHGYILDQFFWEGTNERADGFGGSIEKRTNFAVEIVRAVRARVGKDFPILLRFSQWKQQDYAARLAHSPAELEAFLKPLVEAGVDIFHCSTRRFWEAEFPDSGSDMNLAGWTKKISGHPHDDGGIGEPQSRFHHLICDAGDGNAGRKSRPADGNDGARRFRSGRGGTGADRQSRLGEQGARRPRGRVETLCAGIAGSLFLR